MRIVFLIVLALGATGCVERLQELSHRTCQGLGLELGTPAYTDCFQNEMAWRLQMTRAGLEMASQPPPRQGTTTTVTCREMGNTTNCTGQTR